MHFFNEVAMGYGWMSYFYVQSSVQWFAVFLALYTPIKSPENSFPWTSAVTMFLLPLRVTLTWLLENFSIKIFGGNCQKAPYDETYIAPLTHWINPDFTGAI